MSTIAPSGVLAETTSQPVDPTNISVEGLIKRLNEEVSAASQRVTALQADAAREFDYHQQRLMRFVVVADRIQEILEQRLQGFMSVNVFKDVKQNIAHARGFHGRTTTLTVPYSDKRPAPMEFSFHLDHDSALENIVIDYRLQILPIFIKFDSHDQHVVPIGQPDNDAIAAWIDDKLLGFTRVYFEVYFSDEYQKGCLELDPVMKVRFPKSFAAGKKEYQKRTLYFYTVESLEKFEGNPTEYLG